MTELNREQRRRKQFGSGRSTDHTGWPTSQPNPAMERGAVEDSVAGQPGQEQTDLSAVGSGGATDPPGERPHHERAHPGTTP
jgi:hypothetical protein